MKKNDIIEDPSYKYSTVVNKTLPLTEIRITKKIFSNQKNKEGTCMVYIRVRQYDTFSKKDLSEKKFRSYKIGFGQGAKLQIRNKNVSRAESSFSRMRNRSCR